MGHRLSHKLKAIALLRGSFLNLIGCWRIIAFAFPVEEKTHFIFNNFSLTRLLLSFIVRKPLKHFMIQCVWRILWLRFFLHIIITLVSLLAKGVKKRRRRRKKQKKIIIYCTFTAKVFGHSFKNIHLLFYFLSKICEEIIINITFCAHT